MAEIKEINSQEPIDLQGELPRGAGHEPGDRRLNFSEPKVSKRTAQRHKREAGLIYVHFWINEADIVWKLETLRLLDPNVADQPEKIAAAVKAFLEGVQIDDVKF